MSNANTLFLVLLVTLGVSMAIAWSIVRRSREQASRSLEPLGPPRRSSAATALGRTDGSAPPLTGTGTLVLTDTEVGFAQWRPARTLRIPRAQILAAGPAREHLGKTMKSDVLLIGWSDGGAEEEVAFFVRDLEPWLHDLNGR